MKVFTLKAKYRQSPYGSGTFWKVVEIDNTTYHDLESFGKRSAFKMAMEEFWILFGKILKYAKMDVT